jgi:hypothetical protein
VSAARTGPQTKPNAADVAILLAITVAVGIVVQSVLAGVFLGGEHHQHATDAHQLGRCCWCLHWLPPSSRDRCAPKPPGRRRSAPAWPSWWPLRSRRGSDSPPPTTSDCWLYTFQSQYSSSEDSPAKSAFSTFSGGPESTRVVYGGLDDVGCVWT